MPSRLGQRLACASARPFHPPASRPIDLPSANTGEEAQNLLDESLGFIEEPLAEAEALLHGLRASPRNPGAASDLESSFATLALTHGRVRHDAEESDADADDAAPRPPALARDHLDASSSLAAPGSPARSFTKVCMSARLGAARRLAFVAHTCGPHFLQGFASPRRSDGNSGHASPGAAHWEATRVEGRGSRVEGRGPSGAFLTPAFPAGFRSTSRARVRPCFYQGQARAHQESGLYVEQQCNSRVSSRCPVVVWSRSFHFIARHCNTAAEHNSTFFRFERP